MKLLKNQAIVLLIFLLTLIFAFSVNAKGWETDGYDWYYQDEYGYNLVDTIKSSNGKKYYLGEDGRMVRDYLLEDDNIYYFDENGEMVINTWVAVDPYQVLNPITNGPTVYLYYFGANGRAYKAKDTDVVKKVIDGKKYLFDNEGRMLSGWISESGEMWNYIDYDTDPFDGFIYYAGDETDGVLREGWVSIDDGSMDDKYYEREHIWFYFSSVTNKKIYAENGEEYHERNINGRSYAFDDKGVMLMGWEVQPATRWYADEYDEPDRVGSLVKKRWTNVVPSKELSEEDYENDTYRWFYSESNGDIAKNKVKKINGYYYAFDKQGRMKEGLVILKQGTNEYVDQIDLEATEGKDFMITRKYQSKEDTVTRTFDYTKHVLYYFNIDDDSDLFGSRKTGTVTIPFADKDYRFCTDSLGAIRTVKNRKYYQEGFLLEADPLLTYGIVLDGYMNTSTGNMPQRDPVYRGGYSETAVGGNEYYVSQRPTSYTTEWPHFIAVDKNGKKISKRCAAKKDRDNNYWLIGDNGTFKKVVTVPVKYRAGFWYYKSDKYSAKSFRTSQAWIPFGEPDATGKTVQLERGEGDYELYLLDQYAVNFNWVD